MRWCVRTLHVTDFEVIFYYNLIQKYLCGIFCKFYFGSACPLLYVCIYLHTYIKGKCLYFYNFQLYYYLHNCLFSYIWILIFLFLLFFQVSVLFSKYHQNIFWTNREYIFLMIICSLYSYLMRTFALACKCHQINIKLHARTLRRTLASPRRAASIH